MLKEFRDFALRGNAIDLAVGVIIGGAFGKIVSSLVADVIMPPLGLLIGGVDFSDKALTLKDAVTDAAGKVVTPAVTLNYGLFINEVVNFAIVAFAIFIAIHQTQKLFMRKLAPAADAPPPPTPEEIVLLREIRDALKR
jgi:large conductance mechanosensitive channel